MSNWHRWNLGLGGGLVLAMVLIHAQATAAYAGEAGPGTEAVGELRIEGGSIERLVLADNRGRIREFDRPRAVLSLPEGQYRLQEVSLAGGYRCWPHMVPEGSLVAVSRGRPGILKVGAPLSQRIRLLRSVSLPSECSLTVSIAPSRRFRWR